jgi:hypothetical protein
VVAAPARVLAAVRARAVSLATGRPSRPTTTTTRLPGSSVGRFVPASPRPARSPGSQTVSPPALNGPVGPDR